MQKTVSYGPGSTTTLRMRGVQREDRQFISTDPPGVGPQLHALPYAASVCMNFDSGLVMAAMGTSANNDLEVMCTAETLRAILFGRLLCWPVKSQNTIDRIIKYVARGDLVLGRDLYLELNNFPFLLPPLVPVPCGYPKAGCWKKGVNVLDFLEPIYALDDNDREVIMPIQLTSSSSLATGWWADRHVLDNNSSLASKDANARTTSISTCQTSAEPFVETTPSTPTTTCASSTAFARS